MPSEVVGCRVVDVYESCCSFLTPLFCSHSCIESVNICIQNLYRLASKEKSKMHLGNYVRKSLYLSRVNALLPSVKN